MSDMRKAQTLWDVTAGFRLTFMVAIGAMAVGYVFMFGVPWVAKLAIDAILSPDGSLLPAWVVALGHDLTPTGNNPLVTYLLLAAGATVVLTAMAGSLIYVRGRGAALASEGICRRLRDTLFSHLEHLPVRFHDRSDTGDLVQRCTSDASPL